MNNLEILEVIRAIVLSLMFGWMFLSTIMDLALPDKQKKEATDALAKRIREAIDRQEAQALMEKNEDE